MMVVLKGYSKEIPNKLMTMKIQGVSLLCPRLRSDSQKMFEVHLTKGTLA